MAMLGGKVYNAHANGFTPQLINNWMNLTVEQLKSNLIESIDPVFVQAKSNNFKAFNAVKWLSLENGYITMYNEDIIKKDGGLFHQNGLTGYSSVPADYYFRPFYQYLYSNFKNNSSKICLNGEITGHRTLDLMHR